MLTQEQRRIVEWFKEQTSINIKTKDADLEIKDMTRRINLRLAATLIENFRTLARNFDVQIKEDIEGE